MSKGSLEVLTNMEYFCFFAGKFITSIGGAGIVICVLFDKLARGWTLPINFGWLQWTGLIVSILITMYGAWVDTFLNEQVYPMLYRYLST